MFNDPKIDGLLTEGHLKVNMVQKTPFSLALADHQVTADLIDVDLYRIQGGIAVETDYIIRVASKKSGAGDDGPFETYTLSKTFRHFRSFAKQLKTISDGAVGGSRQHDLSADDTTRILGCYCATVYHLIESERPKYIEKVIRRQKSHYISFVNNGFAN